MPIEPGNGGSLNPCITVKRSGSPGKTDRFDSLLADVIHQLGYADITTPEMLERIRRDLGHRMDHGDSGPSADESRS